MANFSRVIFFTIFVVLLKGDEDLSDFVFSDPDEVMIAQESNQYQTVVEPPVRIVKPMGITNSHRPQYNLDSFEDRSGFEDTSPRKSLVKNYKSSSRIRAKEGMIKDAILKALDRKDHVGKFSQIFPIIRGMSGNQRVALASLVASQVTTPPGRAPLNLVQVRSMFGNSDNTTELMLPILLDMANLFRRAVRSGKEPREAKQPYESVPQQSLRRSDTGDFELDDEPFDMGIEYTTVDSRRLISRKHTNKTDNKSIQNLFNLIEITNKTDIKTNENSTTLSSTTTESVAASTNSKYFNVTRVDHVTPDLMADATNQTLAQDIPVAEKLRALSRYTERKGSAFRRGIYTPKMPYPIGKRTTPEPSSSPQSPVKRRPPVPGQRKLPTSIAEANKCELFTNTLCLNSDDYPTEAIVQTIRRNKAAAAALLADYKEPAEGVIDGVTAAEEAKYNEQQNLVSNRRGDTATRDFASAGEAGFMCPSMVKYARPQRARATSGLWKYIVNTGEHTQTLRLEKCLKPKEPCTYLTDNFKSKCVQVYNYHRLLTWDQQNGLHMDIFKVPTCCSCHIEGYSVAFPPVGHRTQETSSEHFPGEDLSAEQGNHAFENVQSSILKPKLKFPPFTHKKPSDSLPSFIDRKKPLDSFAPFSDSQNFISGSPFNKQSDNDDSIPPNPIDSYGNTYFPDSFNQASNVRQVKRPNRNSSKKIEEVTLPTFLEPPTPAATSTFNFVKDTSTNFKFSGNQFKRTQSRPSLTNRRPIRKKISGGPEDLISSGSEVLESLPNENKSEEDIKGYEDPAIGQVAVVSNTPKTRITIAPKLHAQPKEQDETTSEPKYLSNSNENLETTGKRINYNYHPIIDFFEEDKEIETDDTIDREDIVPSYVPVAESEWKPIDHPPSKI